MYELLFILFFILAIVVVLAIPIVTTRWLYRKLRKTKYGKYAFFIPVIVMIFGTCEIYRALYPNDDFYKQDFEYMSHLKFPKSGTILYKSADYPDIHGHYSSAALVRLIPTERDRLLHDLSVDKAFKTCNIYFNLRAYEKAPFDEKNIREQFCSGKLLISFFQDRETILIQKGISEFSSLNVGKTVSK